MRTGLFVFICIVTLGAGALLLMPPVEVEVPVVVASLATPVAEAREYTLLFTGDIMLARSVRANIEREQDPLYPFLRIADTIRSADIAFANLEGPVSDRGTNQGSQYSFRFEPTGTMSALTFAGFDVVSIANNHIWDWGKDALIDTVLHLDEAGIGHVGAGRDMAEAGRSFSTQIGDTKIAMLGYTNLYPKSLEAGAEYPGVSPFTVSTTIEQLQDLKKSGTDIVIISMHWGDEYATSSNARQQNIGRALIDGGADLVIGHHPHVVQEVEQYNEGWIVYSLGNFVFDQFFSKETMSGLMARALVRGGRIEKIEQIPVQLTPTYQPYIVGGPGDPALEVVE